MNHPLRRELDRYQEDLSLRVLVAENDGPLLRLLSQFLRCQGHEVVAVRDGAELLDELAATLMDPQAPAFDVIVCEHRLPGIPGLAVLAGLRSRDPATAFVLLTDDPDIECRAAVLGATTLGAPFGRDTLEAAVHRSMACHPANDPVNDNGRLN
jgi:CheY-like chemotaxis protein